MMEQEKNSTGNEGKEFILLGEYLKEKRTEKNYSLEKLSQKTKISINILKSLEANDFEHLPSAAYIKGFVRSYVKVLGLPMDEAITKMEHTYLNVLGKPFPALNHTKNMRASLASGQPLRDAPATSARKAEPEAPQPTPHEVIENSDSLIESTKSILPMAIFAAIIVSFVVGYKLISSVVESEVSDQRTKDLGPKIESSSALVNPHVNPHANEKKEEPAKVEEDTEAEAPAVTTAPAEEPAAPEEKPLPEFPRNYPPIDFKKIKGKLFTVVSDAPENDNTEMLPEKIKSSVSPTLQNVYIRAVDGNTWISYKIDSNPIASVIINKGSDLFLQGSEIRLFLGNVNVTKIFYNNHLINTPTRSGVKSLVFPEESNEKYFMPLFPKAKDDVLYTAEEYMKRMKLEEDELAKRKQD